MTDTGQVPGEELPESAGMVEQPGAQAPGAYPYLSETPAEDHEDLLLLPGAQGAWGNEVPPPPPAPVAEVVHEPGPHEMSGRDSGSVDLGGVRLPEPEPAAESVSEPVAERESAPAPAPQPPAARRPLHLGPPTPDSAGSPVRSLADRGPAGAPAGTVSVRQSGAAVAAPEHRDVPRDEFALQGAAPWGVQAQAGPEVGAAETVVRGAEVDGAGQGSEGVGVGEVPQVGQEAGESATPQVVEEAVGDGAAGPDAAHGSEAAAGSEAVQGSDGVPVTESVPAASEIQGQAEIADAAEEFAASAAQSAEAGQFPQAPTSEAAHFSAEAAQVTEPAQYEGPAQHEDPAHLQAPTQAPHTPEHADATHFQPAPAVSYFPQTPDPQLSPHAAEPQLPDHAQQFTEAEPEAPVTRADEAAQPVVTEEAAEFVDPAEAPAQPDIPAQSDAPAPGPADPRHATSADADVPVQGIAQAQPEQPVGQFVPVDGTIPTTPHLAPTPPHGMSVPSLPEAEHPAEAAPAAEEEAAPAAMETAEPSAPEHPTVTLPAPGEAEQAEHAEQVEAAAAEPEATPVPEPTVEATEDAEAKEQQQPVAAQQAEDLDLLAAADQANEAEQADEAGQAEQSGQEESPALVANAADVRESITPAAPGYDDAEREAVLRVMRERRDIRNGFRSDPIPHDVLLRVLEAAHTAPSVGHSQPWDFVVIRSAETRRTMHELAQRQRDAYAKSLPKGRAKQFKELKIEAILDTPVNIVVTADPTRGGRHTLGRHTQPQMAPYSSALAVENLWLAARAEGLGVGWVSFFDEREMVRTLGLPEHLEVVAYLCVGYVDEFPEEPELLQAGWSKRRPLSWVVHEETYGRRALPGAEPHDLLAETVSNIRPLDAKALGEAWERQKRMTKPAGALGMLEIISAQLSGLSRMCPPPIPEPAAVAIFAGDHGVHAQGVTPWPQEVTGQMVANILGGGAVVNAFAGQVGTEVCVVDVGVASDLPATPGLLPRKVRAGTADMTTGPALTREEVKQAIEVGIDTARDLVAAGNKALVTGEMGIANTTASAALIAVFTDADPSEVTGRGTGINDETLARKTEVVRRAIQLHQPDPADPIGVLAAFGGLEHAAMVGLLLGGASLRTPVILDGVSAGAAALVARAIAPEVLAACIAGHRSAEPGHVAALNKLGLRPLVDLDLRLGEGTGALLALPMVQSAARAMHEVATFDSAGVTEK
ncbi:nicotinate-nucleotide--dimethylbenzimidazole phosphoribosyltransferase [Streptomyces ureilyticus]|uniref:Nicotinate-nucleotide--dimethylbenzimidazole phosphoribosyltransferase n=1 Tax=Streptomyces ureilyticus TaxID=1775131 RepID=A0ABX0DML4_9ACTN|nr:nicotinate-nucleotide--dimethylbenzimidazole phosphoribosyltransferase [Streptomyces ureilyticus]NGO41679.1 nicotinate-nucleotide--dimethylbenzimidazole phosphoribosyltransferase [Streptomyces ureilyticus]